MSTKVTDLEKFLDEIWQPFWPTHPDYERFEGVRFPETYREWLRRKGRKRHSLDQTFIELASHKEWSDKVIGRIARCKFWFPSYIDHPLVRYIQQRIVELDQQAKE